MIDRCRIQTPTHLPRASMDAPHHRTATNQRRLRTHTGWESVASPFEETHRSRVAPLLLAPPTPLTIGSPDTAGFAFRGSHPVYALLTRR
jgi:hypothetical protein